MESAHDAPMADKHDEIRTKFLEEQGIRRGIQKAPKKLIFEALLLKKTAASYSPALHCSTIGAGGLNFSVRNGKRWDPAAITT